MTDRKISKIWIKDFTAKRKLPSEFYLYLFNIVKKYISNKINKTTGKWLDIGCGDGRILIPLATRFPSLEFSGIDVNDKIINNLRKGIRCNKIKNISAECYSGEYYLDQRRKFDVISFFQSIHFFKFEDILKKACGRLNNNGNIIIATTTHNQFRSIPYSKNSVIYKIEIERTPDWANIVKILRRQDLRLESSRIFSVIRKFKDSTGLKNYLEIIPYSAFGIIKPSIRKKIIEKIINDYKHKKKFDFTIDKFRVGIFKQ